MDPAHLAGAADEQLADLTLVGEKRLVAANAVHVLLLQDVLLAVQGHFALQAVVALRHVGCCWMFLCSDTDRKVLIGSPGSCWKRRLLTS